MELGGELRNFRAPSKIQLFGALKHLANNRNYLFIQTLSTFKPIQYIVDVGANIGGTAMLFHLAFPDAAILAIEPMTINYDCLIDNIRGISNIVPVKKAAYSEPANIKISLPTVEQRPDMQNKLGNSGLFSIYGKDKEHSETVSAERLDDMVDRPVDILKIDVEGAEDEVLRGAKRVLTKERPIVIMEYRRSNIEMAGFELDYYENFFRTLGYFGVANYLGDVVVVPREVLAHYYEEWKDRVRPIALPQKDFVYAFMNVYKPE